MSRKRSPFLLSYILSGQVLGEVEDTKYLGVTLSDNLDWSKHITTTTTKANARLSFIKRNLKDCPKTLKELAYFSLVRSFTDYCSTVWDPHQKYNHDKLEMVQRRAARFVKSKYKRTESVPAMLNELGWHSLSKRREDASMGARRNFRRGERAPKRPPSRRKRPPPKKNCASTVLRGL